jgi:hypothetical protein
MSERHSVPGQLTPLDAAALGAASLIAKIDATADTPPDLTDEQRDERIRQARKAYFTQLGRKGGLAKSVKARARRAEVTDRDRR